MKSASAIATSIGSATAWAVIDGILGTLAVLLAIVAGLLGLWWGYRTLVWILGPGRGG